MEPILKLDHIQKYYGNEGNITKAIQDISFSVEAGEFLGIMGASGSGKTTLLNCISTIDTVSAYLRDLFPSFIPHLLNAEIRIDQDQGLHSDIVQLQIPGGVIGRDMADALHLIGHEPLVGIVIVKVRDPFIGLAAKFPQIMAGSGSRG